jgi:putative DNA primase/helicase
MQVVTNSIPDYLKRFNHWLCWKYETRTDKPTKVPKSPHTGQNASSTNPDTWGTFEQALAAQHKHGFDGVGFALDHSRVPLVGIDLDHCIVDGELTPLAREIVDTVNGYTEVTPSGAGLRIFAIADLPPGKRKHTGQGCGNV